MNTNQTPAAQNVLFKSLSNEALVEQYWAWRALAATADGVATLTIQCGDRRRAGRAVGGVFRALKNMDIIIAIARQRGVNLVKAA